MKNRVIVLVLAVSLLSGCSVMHPGAANKFDSQSYDVLYVAHSAIETTKAQLAAQPPVYQPNVAAVVKTTLNHLIDVYNIADTAYQLYHTAAIAGTATAAMQADVQTKLNNVSSAVTSLAQTKVTQ